MAEEKVDIREVSWQDLMPWTLLFRAFQATLDMNKLLLAAAGILLTYLGWLLLAWLFMVGDKGTPPDWNTDGQSTFIPNAEKAGGTKADAFKNLRKERQAWNLKHEAVRLDARSNQPAMWELQDIAENLEELNLFEKVIEGKKPGAETVKAILDEIDRREKNGSMKLEEARRYRARVSQYSMLGQYKPAGRLTVSPWSEDRGPNPYLLVTGQAGGIPWQEGGFMDWLTRDQVPVMIEPLVKLIRPIVYFLSPRNNFLTKCYFFSVILFTVLVWSVVGGAITRIAAVQITRGERIGMTEAVRFSVKRLVSYLTAPMFPLVVVGFLMVILAIFWFLGAITFFIGDIALGGLLGFVPLLFGLIMAMALLGLIGWPLMTATISVEGTDSWEAVTRAYGYVYQRPWHYAWYSLVSIFYGGLAIFFVGFMGSLAVYMGKWGLNQAPFSETMNRESTHLFVYAPTSFGWRDLLLEGATVKTGKDQLESTKEGDQLARDMNGADVVDARTGPERAIGTLGGYSRSSRINPQAYQAYLDTLGFGQKIGAGLMAFWLGLGFLVMLGFGYAFFWTASTIIYLLLRKSLESAEFDEVYLEEEEYEATIGTGNLPQTSAPSTDASKGVSLQMVDPGPSSIPSPPSSSASTKPASDPGKDSGPSSPK